MKPKKKEPMPKGPEDIINPNVITYTRSPIEAANITSSFCLSAPNNPFPRFKMHFTAIQPPTTTLALQQNNINNNNNNNRLITANQQSIIVLTKSKEFRPKT